MAAPGPGYRGPSYRQFRTSAPLDDQSPATHQPNMATRGQCVF